MGTEEEHPMLKGFNPIWAGVKHIAGETLKYAAYGAAIVAGISVIPALGLGTAASIFSFFGAEASFAGGTAAVLTKAAGIGAGIGAFLGGLKSVSNVGEAVEYAKQDEIYRKQQVAIFKERHALMQAAQQQGAGMRNAETSIGSIGGVTPNIAMGTGRSQNGMGLS